MSKPLSGRTILFLVTEDWYFWSHRLPIARAARAAGARVVVAARPGEHVARIEGEGFAFEAIGFDRAGLSLWRDLGTIAAIARVYRRVKPDLVHHVAVKPVLLGSIAARLAGTRSIVNALAGLGFLFTNESMRTRAIRWIFLSGLRAFGAGARVRTIIQNDDDRALLEGAGLPGHGIRTIRGSGVDIEAFRPASEPPAPPIVVVCASRMLWDKGIGELVEAARILKEKELPVRVRLVGAVDRNPASIPPQTLEAWSREGVVETVGFSSDVAGEYQRAHVAVLPSYREGLPKSLLEAAACGLAMVACDVPGCREICRHEETGLLVAARDAQALADAIARLVGDDHLRRRLAVRAREVATTEFSETIVAQRTLEVYSELLSSNPSSAPETRGVSTA